MPLGYSWDDVVWTCAGAGAGAICNRNRNEGANCVRLVGAWLDSAALFSSRLLEAAPGRGERSVRDEG